MFFDIKKNNRAIQKITLKKFKPITFFFFVLSGHIFFALISDMIESSFNLDTIDLKDIEEIKKDIVEFFFYVVIFAPIIEEICYRLPIKKSSVAYLAIPVSLLFISYNPLILRVIDIIYSITLIGYLTFSNKLLQKILIVVSIFVFTFSHASNYSIADLESLNLIEFVFLFSSQFILAIVTTFFRLIYSFKWALLYHFLYNLIIFFIGLYEVHN